MADVTYRSAYGKGLYGVEAYGVSGAFKEGEAIVIGVTSTASAVVRVRLAASIVASSSSNASAATRVREVSATKARHQALPQAIQVILSAYAWVLLRLRLAQV